jgi:hypothetical protein
MAAAHGRIRLRSRAAGTGGAAPVFITEGDSVIIGSLEGDSGTPAALEGSRAALAGVEGR